jgi:hypothetical protein
MFGYQLVMEIAESFYNDLLPRIGALQIWPHLPALLLHSPWRFATPHS